MRRFFWQYIAMEGIAAIAIVVSRTFSWMRALLLSELISATNEGPVEIVFETRTELKLITHFTSLRLHR
jgi:hypothetical protein